jgi:hypothetical protein
MPITEVQVGMLGLHRRRQHDVGVVHCVRREMLEHDGEQILARQRPTHPVLVGIAAAGVGRDHEQCLDRRVIHGE